MLTLYDLTIDYEKRPSLAATRGMRFGWKLHSDRKNVLQKCFSVRIVSEGVLVFDSGVMESEKNVNVSFGDLQLPAGAECELCVSVQDNHGDTAVARMSFSTEISPEAWDEAAWIKPAHHIQGWAPYLRTKFHASDIRRAVMYACGLGCAEYYLNGERVGDEYIDPPMSNYEKTVYYRRYDVTSQMRQGGNALCVLLGDGFYSQNRVWGRYGFGNYGPVCAKIRLEITCADGSRRVIVTDTSDWVYKYSPVTVNNIYGGETYDSRLETEGFADYDSADDGWAAVVEDAGPKGALTPCNMPPVRVLRELPAVKVQCLSGVKDGAWIFDMGENIAGVAEYHLPESPAGAVYVFRYAETLREGGGLDYRSTGAYATQCIQQDMYICKGTAGGEVYRPRFCYHGYRYIEITGIHDYSEGFGTMPKQGMVKGIQLSTDLVATGKFSCSHEYLDKLHQLMVNTFRSNFHGIPEDCPTRERCGWLGDAQIVCNWAFLNYNAVSSYEKYLNDIRTTKEVYGVWQDVAPGKRGCGEARPLWGCAQVLIPYYLYRYCGDAEAVTRNFDLMEAWVAHELARSEDYVISAGRGDWEPPVGNTGERRIPVPHSSTFMFYEICDKMAELCRELGLGDKAYYAALAEKIKESAIRHFYDRDVHSYGYWGSDGVALELGIYPETEKDALLAQLSERMKADRYEMSTGIYANKYLVPVLFREDRADEALKFLFNPNFSSFATMIDDGATTIWEALYMRSVMPGETWVPSYDHPMQGGFLYLCYTHLAGLVPESPGFQRFRFAPCHVKEIEEVYAEYDAAVGKIRVSCQNGGESGRYRLTVPANAECILDFRKAKSITVNGEPCSEKKVLGSGEYEITVAYLTAEQERGR